METDSNCKLWWALEKLVSTGVNNGERTYTEQPSEGISDKMPYKLSFRIWKEANQAKSP